MRHRIILFFIIFCLVVGIGVAVFQSQRIEAQQVQTIIGKGSTLPAYIASNVTYNNNNTLANTNLNVTVVSGGIYAVNLNVFQSTGAGTSLNVDFNGGTMVPANFLGQYRSGESGTSLGANNGVEVTAINTAFTCTCSSSANGQIQFLGTLEVTTGGTFIMRAAQDAATAVNTVLKRDSTLTLTKLN